MRNTFLIFVAIATFFSFYGLGNAFLDSDSSEAGAWIACLIYLKIIYSQTKTIETCREIISECLTDSKKYTEFLGQFSHLLEERLKGIKKPRE